MDEFVSLLQEAVLAARANVVNDLLEKGGDVEARDQDGNTLICLAARWVTLNFSTFSKNPHACCQKGPK